MSPAYGETQSATVEANEATAEHLCKIGRLKEWCTALLAEDWMSGGVIAPGVMDILQQTVAAKTEKTNAITADTRDT
ncbi:LOW QUALITY PROTEIN: Protein of unknown function [Gryllus bimaculatus]|nr:LOW QUALITY PROTEIN: Protein of unknown function [Gryllus bimaculatus]